MRIPRIKDLPCIARGDGCDLVGGFNRALHHVDIPVIFEQICMIHRDAHDLIQHFLAVFALICDIMDREYGVDIIKSLLILIEDLIIDRSQSSLPVIAVNDSRLEVDDAQHFEDRTAEEYEAFAVVIEAVDAVALEVILIVDEVIGHALMDGGENTAILLPPCDIDGNRGDKGHVLAHIVADRLIERNDNAAVMAFFVQCKRQRACNICEAAGCDIRSCFTCCI